MATNPLAKSTIHTALAGLFLVATAAAAAPARDPADHPSQRGPLRVFILAGQSNMEGKSKVSLLQYQATQPATRQLFAHLRKGDSWVEREDVWIKFMDRQGNLTVGSGSPGCIGPELEFRDVVGDRYHASGPVLLIKTAWGGRSLYRDFRPPGGGLPPAAVLEGMLERKHNDMVRRRSGGSADRHEGDKQRRPAYRAEWV